MQVKLSCYYQLKIDYYNYKIFYVRTLKKYQSYTKEKKEKKSKSINTKQNTIKHKDSKREKEGQERYKTNRKQVTKWQVKILSYQ